MALSTNQPFIFSLAAVNDPAEACHVRKLLKALGRVYGLKVSWPTPSPSDAPERTEGGLDGESLPQLVGEASARLETGTIVPKYTPALHRRPNVKVATSAPVSAPGSQQNRVFDTASGVCAVPTTNNQHLDTTYRRK